MKLASHVCMAESMWDTCSWFKCGLPVALPRQGRCGGSCNRGTGEIGSVAGSGAGVGVPVTAVQGRLVNEAG